MLQSPRGSPPELPPVPDIPPIPDIDLPGFNRPLTGREIESLREVRGELSNHLSNVQDRRQNLLERLSQASGPERAGLEQHLAVLDARIVRLENDLEKTAQMLTRGMLNVETGMLVPPQPPWSGMPPENVTAIASVFTIFVLAPIAFAIARLIWRRATGTRPTAAGWDSSQRMERLEHAVDAIAVEVERISEGQRFVTKLLTESPNVGALNSGNRVGEMAPQREALKVPRDER